VPTYIKKTLTKNNIKCSMTQNANPYENAVAERINGILKQEFNIDKFNKELPIMKVLVKKMQLIFTII